MYGLQNSFNCSEAHQKRVSGSPSNSLILIPWKYADSEDEWSATYHKVDNSVCLKHAFMRTMSIPSRNDEPQVPQPCFLYDDHSRDNGAPQNSCVNAVREIGLDIHLVEMHWG